MEAQRPQKTNLIIENQKLRVADTCAVLPNKNTLFRNLFYFCFYCNQIMYLFWGP